MIGMSSAGSDETVPTNTDLLLALRDRGNDQAWTLFCARYRPVLISFARRLGLADPDAQDAAQDTLLAFATSFRLGEYDRSRGRLRSWLFSIASHKIRDLQRKLCRRPLNGEVQDRSGAIENIPDDRRVSDIWENEWQKAIIETCLDEIRNHVEPSTIQAFRMYVLEDLNADDVAERLSMTRNAVFKAQRRVLTRMREVYEQLMSDE
jgi:RNA polymerase sigma-70 factor, ECF subfamily